MWNLLIPPIVALAGYKLGRSVAEPTPPVDFKGQFTADLKNYVLVPSAAVPFVTGVAAETWSVWCNGHHTLADLASMGQRVQARYKSRPAGAGDISLETCPSLFGGQGRQPRQLKLSDRESLGRYGALKSTSGYHELKYPSNESERIPSVNGADLGLSVWPPASFRDEKHRRG